MERRLVPWLACASLLFATQPLLGQARQITGTVTRAGTKQPVAEATVVVVGAAAGARTNTLGRYVLDAPAGEVKLSVRAIGLQRKLVTVAAGQATADVALEEDPFRLDEVVVSGQATSIERRNAATSTAVVSSEDIAATPQTSIDRALQGKVAGAVISTNSGAPGGGLQVQIRGSGTVLGASDPLFVVDGVIYSNASIPSGRASIVQGVSSAEDDAVNRLADLNPADIVSIEVLKSAAASSIYGSKAANGVVIITTKRGQGGTPKVEITQRVGVFTPQRGYTFRTWDKASAIAQFGDGAAAYFGADGKALNHYDHLAELTSQRPLSYETSASVAGGNDITKYFLSLGSKYDGGIIENTGAGRQSLRINIDQKLGSKWDVGVSSTYGRTLSKRGYANNVNTFDSYTYALAYIPDFVPLKPDANGVYPTVGEGATVVNPLQLAHLGVNTDETYRFTGGAHIGFQAVSTAKSTLRFTAAGGADVFTQKNTLYKPPELFSEQILANPGATVLGNADSRFLNGNFNGVHTYSDEGFRATTAVGVQYEERALNSASVLNRGLVAGISNITAGSLPIPSQLNTKEHTLAAYVQEDFLTLGERLLLSAGVRAERSSVNGNVGTYNTYPKGSASYRFPELLGKGSDVKLRAAYGQAGNQPLFGQKFTNLSIVSTNGQPGIGLPGSISLGGSGGGVLGLATVKPERLKEFEGGVDASLWGGRATIELTAFSRRTTDLLLQAVPAPSLGFGGQVVQGGEFRNQGLEAALGVTPVNTPDVQWLFRTTFSLLRSKVVSLPVPTFVPPNGGFGNTFGQFQVEQGQSITQIVGNADSAGVPVVRKLGDATPNFRMSFTNDITWKKFQVSFLWDWQQGGKTINLFEWLVQQYGNAANSGTPAGITLQNAANNSIASPFVQDATFLKLREASLSYTLPERWAHKVGGSSARVSLAGRNLLIFTKYSGFDPEVSNFGASAIARSLDVAPFPPSRAFFFNVTVGF